MGSSDKKFKVGDKVRVSTMRHGTRQHGKTGTVTGVERRSSDLDIEVDYDEPLGLLSRNQYSSSDLELVPQFAVGDRVNWKGQSAWQGATIVGADTVYDWKIEGAHGRFSYANSSELEPAPQPHLTIVAGRYYKTRDGRKVGPISRHKEGAYYWSAPWECVSGYGPFWCEGGEFHKGDESPYDLVAEWPTAEKSYTSNPAAQVDNLRDEYGPVGVKDEPKFKVGDRVAFRDTYGLSSVRGKEATVISVDGWGIQVDMGTGHTGISTEAPESLRLVAPAANGKAIVALIENGQPLPSTRPHVHGSREDATKEAARLAGVHKGQEFGVYELVATRREARVYEHEWQRLAVGGVTTKIAAIKELRRVSGLGLYAAKVGVEDFVKVEQRAA